MSDNKSYQKPLSRRQARQMALGKTSDVDVKGAIVGDSVFYQLFNQYLTSASNNYEKPMTAASKSATMHQ